LRKNWRELRKRENNGKEGEKAHQGNLKLKKEFLKVRRTNKLRKRTRVKIRKMLRLRMEMIFEGNNGRNRKEELHRPKVNRTNRIKPYKKSQTISQLLPKH
jgi:hypothetical protein